MVLVLVPLVVVVFWLLYFLMPPAAGLPILAYHRVSGHRDGTLTISVAQLDQQLALLQRDGYHTVTFADLRNLELNGAPLPPKPLIITFDDDHHTVYRLAYPLLKKYRFRATVFLTTDSTANFSQLAGGNERVLGYESLHEMYSDGIDFALRSQKLEVHQEGSASQIEADIDDCLAALKRTDHPFIKVLAYPYGLQTRSRTSKIQREVLARLGFDYALRIGSRLNSLSLKKKYDLVRISIDGTNTLEQFRRRVSRGRTLWN